VVTAIRELLRLTPVYEQVEGGWTQAGLVELPGVITAAPTREEAQDMLLDALREFLLSFGDGSPPPSANETEGLTLSVTIDRSPAA
jgi:predicted RNase H-like HicB family nuclease